MADIVKLKKDLPGKRNRDIVTAWVLLTARANFSICEMRILTFIYDRLNHLLLGHQIKDHLYVQPDVWGGAKFTIPLVTLDFDGNHNYAQIKAAIRSLNKRQVLWSDEKVEEGSFYIVESYSFRRNGPVEIKISEKLIDVFQRFLKRRYCKYRLSIALSLQSVYSVRFYAMISEQENFTFTMSIDYLKEMFGVTGKYKQNRQFIDHCIEGAKRELDKKANYSFVYEYKNRELMKGKRLDKIRFRIVRNVKNDDFDKMERDVLFKNMAYIPGAVRLSNHLINECGFDVKGAKLNRPIIAKFAAICNKMALDPAAKANYYKAAAEKRQSAGHVMNVPAYIVKCMKSFVEENEPFIIHKTGQPELVSSTADPDSSGTGTWDDFIPLLRLIKTHKISYTEFQKKGIPPGHPLAKEIAKTCSKGQMDIIVKRLKKIPKAVWSSLTAQEG